MKKGGTSFFSGKGGTLNWRKNCNKKRVSHFIFQKSIVVLQLELMINSLVAYHGGTFVDNKESRLVVKV